MPVLADDFLEVDIGRHAPVQIDVEGRGGRTIGVVRGVGLQSAFDDFGDATTFVPREAVGELARLGAADGELGFGHGGLPMILSVSEPSDWLSSQQLPSRWQAPGGDRAVSASSRCA